jgi:hypothetical protein
MNIKTSHTNNIYKIEMTDSIEKLEIIIDWASKNPKIKFDTSTYEGIYEFYEKTGVLTQSQESAIQNAFYKFRIHKWYEKQMSEVS